MADRPISGLTEATSITSEDLLVLQQGGIAKKITGETFTNQMAERLDGHGGIHAIEKTGTSGLVDTYTVTLADGTSDFFYVTNGKTIDRVEKTDTNVLVDTYTITYNDETTSTFQITNGRGIQSISLISRMGLEDTYKITFTDETETEFVITNGEKGDQGDFVYVWIKYSTNYPSVNSDMHDEPDNYIGIYTGFENVSPPSYETYSWFKIKGEKGDKGDDLLLLNTQIEYGTSADTSIQPTNWGNVLPIAPQGYYMWTRIKFNYGNGTSSQWFYTRVKNGQDGQGGGNVQTVNGVSPVDGDIPLISVEDNVLVIKEAT